MSQYIDTKPHRKFLEIVKIARFCSGAVGADVLDPNYRFNALTAFVFSAIFCFLSFNFLTMVKYLTEDWTASLDVFTVMGGGLQGCTKLIVGVYHTKKIVEMGKTLDDIYHKYELKGDKYERTLLDFCDTMKRVLVTVGVLYFLTTILMIGIACVIVMFSSRRPMMMLFLVPGLDIETNFGYFCTTIFHAVCIVLGGFGLYSGDTFVLLFLTHALLFYEIFALKIEDLNEYLEQDDTEEKIVMRDLQDLVEWHQFYFRFNEDCNHVFYWVITVQVVCATVSVAITLFNILVKDWPGAYAYLFIAVESLYIYCILGTRIDIYNDKFSTSIYDINWYKLRPSHQKVVRLMLMRSQRPSYINIAGVLPLTVSTALRITKTIYSMLMMIVQFLD